MNKAIPPMRDIFGKEKVITVRMPEEERDFVHIHGGMDRSVNMYARRAMAYYPALRDDYTTARELLNTVYRHITSKLHDMPEFDDNLYLQLREFCMSNQIQVIMPYLYNGTWVFDDPAKGLDKEPFVCGIPEMINNLVAEIPNAVKGFRCLFSAYAFPGYQRHLHWKYTEYGGNWYTVKIDGMLMTGWLCPALFKYFPSAPQDIYVKAEAL